VSAVLPGATLAALMHFTGALGVPPSSTPAIGIGVLAALGVSLSLSGLPSERPDLGRFLFVACCGLAVGYATSAVAAVAADVRLPVPELELTGITGDVRQMSGDSREQLVVIRVASAGSPWVNGTAAGEIRALLPGDDMTDDGTAIRVGSTVTVTAAGSVWRDRSNRIWMRGVVSDARSGVSSTNAVAAAARTAVRGAINGVAGEAAPLLAALLLGDGSDVDPRVDLLFRRSGTIHLLALSGMHLAVIAVLVRGGLRPFVGPRVAAAASVVAAVLYVMLVGPRPGLVRACLLVGLATALTLCDRRRPLVELLAAAFLVQLIIQPETASTLGFQLSYLSLLGISVLAAAILGTVSRWVPPSVASPLAAGTGAQLLTVPLLLARFGRWYPIGILASLLMGPVVLLFMSLGLVAVLLSMAGLTVVSRLSLPVLELLSRVAEWAGWVFSAAPVVAPADLTAVVALSTTVATAAVAIGLATLYGAGDAGGNRLHVGSRPQDGNRFHGAPGSQDEPRRAV
jgi:ComEC/Rec2-related protein